MRRNLLVATLVATCMCGAFTGCAAKENTQTTAAQTTATQTKASADVIATVEFKGENATIAVNPNVVDTKDNTSIAGAYDLSGVSGAALTQDAKKAFESAMKELEGVEYKPVALLGTQMVSGTNYAILCSATVILPGESQTTLKLVKISENLQGEATIMSISDFDINAIFAKKDTNSNAVAGGAWTVVDQVNAPAMPEKAATAFDKANAEFDGSNIEPMAYLGSQLVSGTNYLYICKTATVTQTPVVKVQLVQVYEELDGSCHMTDFWNIDLGGYK